MARARLLSPSQVSSPVLLKCREEKDEVIELSRMNEARRYVI
jgi:hypothetical protein